ncbi:hypothetical protein N0V86_009103 [Didymella sp. IMI 355093]|nr:hypothetical protein N0V86_009103 [Didymella sp. IMI 355093]
MLVHIITFDKAFGNEYYELDVHDDDYPEQHKENDALAASTWIENLKALNPTAAALLTNTIVVESFEDFQKAFKQESSAGSSRPRKVMLTGYSKVAHCLFKYFLDLPCELRQKIWTFAAHLEPYSYGSIHPDCLVLCYYVRKNTSPRNPLFLPNLCRVSEFTRQEMMEVFIHP